MHSIAYQLILMITIYVLIGCIVYLLGRRNCNKEMTNARVIFYLFCGFLFRPVIKMIVCLDTMIALHIDFEKWLHSIYKDYERHEGVKPSRLEKRKMRSLLKQMVREGDVEDYE